jgi:glycosyltransferase involved in cell wall biosynthesis
MSRSRPRVVLLRGHNANVWDLRPLELLQDEFELTALVTGSNLHRLDGLALPTAHAGSPRDRLPAGRAAGAAAYLLGERYLGLEEHLRGAAIVHAAEIGTWFSAQAARLKAKLGFRLVLTVWETIPWRGAYRWPRERRYREAVLPASDLLLATTVRARDALLLEGVPGERIVVSPPGVDLDRFSTASGAPLQPPLLLSAGRLVWEKGHQDALRALAALHRGIGGPPLPDVRMLVLGDGPEASRLRRYAADLGVGGAVEFRPTVPYDEMPALYRSATGLVLGSLPTRGWEEQFGMVLVEAMASGTPVVAADSGAIPEVLGSYGALVRPGDWKAMAEALRAGPLGGARPAPDPAVLARFSAEGAASRTRDAYRALVD